MGRRLSQRELLYARQVYEGSGFIEVTDNVVYNVRTPMNCNNRAQNRIATCHEHDNFFGIRPGGSARAPGKVGTALACDGASVFELKVEGIIVNAGLMLPYRPLLEK